MLNIPAPSRINGHLLAEQLAAAGIATSVALDGDTLILRDLDESQRNPAQAVVDAHTSTADADATRVQTEAANETTIRDRAATALADNATFLGLTSPSNAQVVAQVKALTRQNNALIRLVLRRFDSTD